MFQSNIKKLVTNNYIIRYNSINKTVNLAKIYDKPNISNPYFINSVSYQLSESIKKQNDITFIPAKNFYNFYNYDDYNDYNNIKNYWAETGNGLIWRPVINNYYYSEFQPYEILTDDNIYLINNDKYLPSLYDTTDDNLDRILISVPLTKLNSFNYLF